MDFTVEYFTAEEQEREPFIRVPKILVENQGFQALSADAKLLYSVMRNRMELSRRNGWVDTEGRVFICYKVSDSAHLIFIIMQLLSLHTKHILHFIVCLYTALHLLLF